MSGQAVCGECSGTGVFALDPGQAVERCDTCQRYEGDLDAALALAQRRGLGERVLYSDDPDDPDHSCEFTGTYDDVTWIAQGTSPWLEARMDHQGDPA